MRLKEYLSYSGLDSKTNTFRALSVKLTDEEKIEHREVVSEVAEKYELSKDVIDTIEDLNKELKRSYRGKLRFGLCLDEGYTVDKLRAKNIENIKRRFFEVNQYLSTLQLKLEKKIASQTHK